MVDNNAEIGLVVLFSEFPLDAGASKTCRGTQAVRVRRSCKPASHARTRGLPALGDSRGIPKRLVNSVAWRLPMMYGDGSTARKFEAENR
jgi:hypothetical protein